MMGSIQSFQSSSFGIHHDVWHGLFGFASLLCIKDGLKLSEHHLGASESIFQK